MFNLLTVTSRIDFSFLLSTFETLFDFFGKLSVFAMTPCGAFIDFCEGDLLLLEYVFNTYRFGSGAIGGSFVLSSTSFGGVLTSIVGYPLSLLMGGLPYSTPLVLGILLSIAEWYFILAFAKWLFGLIF